MQNTNHKNTPKQKRFPFLFNVFLRSGAFLKLVILLMVFLFSNPSFAQKQDNLSKPKTHPEFFLCKLDTPAVDIQSKGRLAQNICREKPNKFNYIYAKNCSYWNSYWGNAITPKYITVYDRRDETLTYLKLKDSKGKEYVKIKKHIEPKANREMYFAIIAQDKDYHLKLESDDYFKEYEEAFAKNVQKANPDAAQENKSGDAQQKDKINPEKTNNAIVEQDLTINLMSLEESLIILNYWYPRNSLVDDDYYQDLNCLRLKILDRFNFSIIVDKNTTLSSLEKEALFLADTLRKIASTAPNKEGLEAIIESIFSKYYIFISVQIQNFHLYASQIQIPDKDFFNMSVEHKTKDTTITVLSRHFKVSGGFKIDYSAGLFLTGLSVPEFLVQPHSFRYREANLSVDPNTGTIDTTFTGTIIETKGNLIHTKNPRMNYAAGFLSHAYIRTGSFANLSLATGVLVNNDGFKVLLGSSVLLSIRKSRVAFSGGLAFGKQKTLSPTVENSVWKDSYKEGNLYPLSSDVPLFFNGTDVPIYERWQTSWYFGLTYNFNSVTIHW